MKYIGIGFCMAFGWFWGDVFAKTGAKVLAEKIKPWCEKNAPEKPREVETKSGFTPKAVKNQIGFDY